MFKAEHGFGPDTLSLEFAELAFVLGQQVVEGDAVLHPHRLHFLTDGFDFLEGDLFVLDAHFLLHEAFDDRVEFAFIGAGHKFGVLVGERRAEIFLDLGHNIGVGVGIEVLRLGQIVVTGRLGGGLRAIEGGGE